MNKNLIQFDELTSLGVLNAVTSNNEVWGDMKISSRGSSEKYEELFRNLEIANNFFVYLDVDHNDNIQSLTKGNLETYAYFNRYRKNGWRDTRLGPILVASDGIITKERVPIVVAPADCYVVSITGVDEKDGKRFLAILHVGLSGVVLGIHKKALALIQSNYNTDNLQVFVFPGISKREYKKSGNDKYVSSLASNSNWENFIDMSEGYYHIDVLGKIKSDLKGSFVEFNHMELDTFVGEQEGRLYSRTYQKRSGLKFKNFAVILSL